MVEISQIIEERELLLYPHIPVGVFRNSGVWPEPKHQYSLFIYTDDDSNRIIEWIIYHKLLGFEQFYIYSYHNDPKQFYKQLLPFTNAASPIVTYYHYPDPGNAHQAFCHFYRNHAHETKWILWLNIDEFLCLKNKATIRDFITADYQGVDSIYFNLCQYGHNNFDDTPDGDILFNYIHRTDIVSPLTRVMIQSKSVPYSTLYHNFSIEFQSRYDYLNPELVSSNVLMDDFSSYFIDYPEQAELYLSTEDNNDQILETAYIAHFGLPSFSYIEAQISLNEPFQYYGGEICLEEITVDNSLNYFQQFNIIEDKFLHELWVNQLITAWDYSVFPINFWSLLSENKPALQSSTINDKSPEEDACQLINGKLLGIAQNSTQIEDNPWWQIDLLALHNIHEIQVYNRLDNYMHMATNFELFISSQGQIWQSVIKKCDNNIFGGLDGSPFVWTSEQGLQGRFVKLVISGNKKQIGLDQIQIFGEIL